MKFKDFYHKKGITEATLEAMSAKELAELHSDFNSELQASLMNEVTSKAKSEDLEALKSKIESLGEFTSKESFTELETKYKALALELTKLKDADKSTLKKVDSIESVLKANEEALAELMSRKSTKGISMEFKAVGTMGTGNVIPTTAGGISVLLNDAETGILGIPRSRPFFSQLFPSSPTTGNTVSYAEMVTPEGGAAMTAEGALKSQADFNLEEKAVNVRKVTAYIKTSKESLSDIPALAGEINNELLTLVELKADAQILSGDGTGQNLTGITSVASAFAAGDFASAIPTPNEYDVINVAINQIEIAEVISGEPAGFMPNIIVMNPTDIKRMKLTKSTTGEYVFDTVEGIQIGTQIDSVPVLANPRMPKGYFLVMDSSKGTIRIRENANLSIGYENDDYTKNLVTILAEKRLAFYIKAQNVKAFVYGAFATAKTAIQG